MQPDNVGAARVSTLAPIYSRVSLGSRKFLVTLQYARHKLRFSVLSDEATSPKEALNVALLRTKDYTGKPLKLGDLIESKVETDSEEARTKAGIQTVGYPAIDRRSAGTKWYSLGGRVAA